ncbi:MAG: TonB-dependent receptor [Acidobacteria bacterium]|nr:TonB-dependent receptor [Acidobacteriota bacterium]
MKTSPGRLLFGILTALLLTVSAAAQDNSGTINGRVTDTTGAFIPGVTISLTSPAIQGARNAVTDETGSYRFILLPPGTYSVTYELPGFKTLVREGIIVQGSRTVTLAVALEVATVAETVTVTGESPVVDVQNATVGVAFNQTLLRDLTGARDVWAVLGQTPGVTMTSFDVGGSTAGTQKGYRGYGISGQTWITVDGVSTTEGTSGAGMYYDYGAFSEITVQAAANSAEVAVPGTYTNTVMKTGGNQIKGEVYVDWEDDKFQGDNSTAELKNQGFSQADKFSRYNVVNGSAGGPFIKDKFWWFTSYLYQFSGLTTALNKSETDLTGGGPFETRLGGISFKLNYQLSPSNQLVWSHQRTTKNQPYRNGQGANARFYIIESTQNEEAIYFTNKAQFTSVLSNRMTLDTAWQWYNLFDPRYAWVKKTPWQDTATGNRRGAFGREADTYRNRHQFYANVAYSKSGFGGTHDIKFGFGEIYENNGGKTDCEFNDEAHSLVPCVAMTKTNLVPNEITINDGPLKDRRVELLNTYAFLQDKWQIGKKLTLNLGLRFDRYHSWYPEQGNPSTGPFASTRFFANQLFGQNYPRRDMPVLTNVVPRIAFVYDVFGNTKTALKASYGRYAENTGTFASAINPQALHTATYRACNATVTTNCATLPVTVEKIAAIAPTSTSAQAALPAIDPNLSNAYVDEYTAGIEQEVIENLGVSVLYVRKIGHNLRDTLNRTYALTDYTPVIGIDMGLDGRVGTSDDKRITIFERAVATRGTDTLLTNFDAGNNFSTIEFSLTKRFSDGWSILTGYDWTKLNLAGSTSQDPNVLAFQNGHYSQWTYKLLANWYLPYGIRFSGTFNAQRGATYARTQQFQGSLRNILNADGTVRTSNLRQGTGAITLENNNYYLPTVKLTSLRAEKNFRFTERQSVDAMFDLYNLFNWNTITAKDATTNVITVNGVQIPRFGVATNVLPPRIFKLGIRYNF